jgi:hypothetical protein
MERPTNTSSRRLAAPKPWTVMILGVFHEHAVIAIILIGLAPLVALKVIGPDELPGLVELALVGLALLLMSGGARHFVLAPLLRVLKPWLTHSFHVLYFRSFEERSSHSARDNISPILGCMGKLTTVHNPQYIQGLTPVDGHSHDEDSWFAWLELGEILSDGLATPKFADDEWQDGVRALLRESDAVVIDVTGGSSNVDWELEQARATLPSDRVILLRASDAPVSTETGNVIEYEASTRGRYRLRRALVRRLRNISSAEALAS